MFQIYQELTLHNHCGDSCSLNRHCLSSRCDVQVIITESSEGDVDKLEYQKPAYVAVGLIMAITGIAVFLPMFLVAISMNREVAGGQGLPCADQCRSV